MVSMIMETPFGEATSPTVVVAAEEANGATSAGIGLDDGVVEAEGRATESFGKILSEMKDKKRCL